MNIENNEETMIFPLPWEYTPGLSSKIKAKLGYNSKDRGKMNQHSHKPESGRDIANNDHEWNLSNNHIHDQQTPLGKIST